MSPQCVECDRDRAFLFECSECGRPYCDDHVNESAHDCCGSGGGGGSATAATGNGSDSDRGGRATGALGGVAGAPIRVAGLASAAGRRVVGSVASAVTSGLTNLRNIGAALPARAPTPDSSGERTGVLATAGRAIDGARPRPGAVGRRLGAVRRRLGVARRRSGAVAGRLGEAKRRVRSPLGSFRAASDSTAEDGGTTLPRPGRRVAVVAAVAMLLLLGFNVGAAATGAVDVFRPVQVSPDGPPQLAGPATVEAGSVENATFAAVNDARRNASASPLERNASLRRVAEYHAEDMADRGYAGSTSPDGENVSDRLERFGVQCDRVGQMVLWVEGAHETEPNSLGTVVVSQWRERAEHDDLLTNATYDRGAVGAAWNDDGRLYVSLATCGS